MVSLNKQPQQIREYTPEHLIDEETTIRQSEVRQKQPLAVRTPTEDIQAAVTKDGGKKERLDKQDIDVQDLIESIIFAVVIGAILLFMVLFLGRFLAEGLQLAKDVAFGK